MSGHSIFVHKLKGKGNAYYILITALVLFVGLNIFYSQTFPTIMDNVFNGKERAVVDYLRRTKNEVFFQEDMLFFQEKIGGALVGEVNRDQQLIDRSIVSLLLLRDKQRKNPEILYNLHLLYQEKGAEKMSDLYLRQAKQIDPTIQ